jgi:hypothetical protein
MCALARPTAATLVIGLSQRLAEDYPQVPLPEVSKVVKREAAAKLTISDRTTVEELESAFTEIEQRARRTLSRRSAGRGPRRSS